ncbi:potassium-transporting ATPase subunit KdpA [Seleniivibrio woodruffii]|uniref:potassium-transporting ATPase subunit KdpA n=1 Tax=Seleniivibrio woodruffii TaxID=1078050 RepID=UPI002409B927|nr:potassium-transporting ATPase subunit KdpA [Seleniivibrio woodruffii]
MILVTMVIGISAVLSWYLGKYMAYILDTEAEGTWRTYLKQFAVFNALMFAVCFTVLSFQQYLPLNPDGRGALTPDLIFNTTASFVTNTNLQHYSGEVSMSYFSQLFALMWLQFVSAATGIAALAALSRGLSGKGFGNFYKDMTRATLFILLPVAFVVAVLLIFTGVPMTFGGTVEAHTLEGAIQNIARGPAAAFIAIKQLGSNGGGFFGPNSAHPFENPSFWSNIIETMSIIIIPMSCVWMFGRLTGKMRHAAVIFGVMLLLLVMKISFATYFESAPTGALAGLDVQTSSNLEGKELRFGTSAAPLWTAVTTSTSNGSVNSMHDSLNPLTGLVPLTGMWLNETFGGVGVGMINMFIYILTGVFICGMMVGRTPGYLGRKVETQEMKLVLLALLVHPLCILGGTALFTIMPWGAETVHNAGAHGFTEILYEFTSASANNGSGFEGLGDNTPAWNTATGLVMLISRYVPIVLPLMAVGSLSAKKISPDTNGTLHTDTLLFGAVILGSIIFIGALLFMPVAVLGPVSEYMAGALK